MAVKKPNEKLSIVRFYCYNSQKKIVVSNLPLDKIKKKFGFNFEILTSVNKESYSIVMDRIKRSYPSFEFLEKMFVKREVSEEVRKKLSLSKLNKPRSEEVKRRISETMKGKSNFEGKKHRPESKSIIAAKMLGNQHVKDKNWIYNPHKDVELRIDDLNVPNGFIRGRDYDSTEGMFYARQIRRKNLRPY